jgi:adenylate cyclase
VDDHPGAALATARHLAAELSAKVPELDFGIGVSTGTVVAGHLGDDRRYEYTIIGDMVNVAARLTDVAKGTRGRVLADRAAVAAAPPDEADHRVADTPRRVRGRRDAVPVAVPVDGLDRPAHER